MMGHSCKVLKPVGWAQPSLTRSGSTEKGRADGRKRTGPALADPVWKAWKLRIMRLWPSWLSWAALLVLAGPSRSSSCRNQTPQNLRAPAVLVERATPPTTARLAPVLMTRVGIAASPALRAGFLICAEKGFMVLSCLMRQQRAGGRRAVDWCSYLLWVKPLSTGS